MARTRLSCLALASCVALGIDAAPLAGAADIGDPFASRALHAATPGDSVAGTLRAACRGVVTGSAMSLAEVADYALCNNPQTRLAWANAKGQAAQVGLAESAYLPSLSASVTESRNRSNVAGPQTSYGQTLAATQDATLQSVFLSAVQAYYQRYSAEATVIAATQAEGAAKTALGTLANAMGLDAQEAPPLAPPPQASPALPSPATSSS